MYKMLMVEDKIRVPPAKFSLGSENAIKASLDERWEGTVDKNLGVVLSVVSIENTGEGKILPGDGAIHYPVTFSVIVYQPEMYEIVKGQVIDITEFGVFVRMGPVDGMVHVSQLMDDFVSYDAKNSIFLGRDSKRILKEGDVVRARIVSVSMGPDRQYKIGLTTRQPGLGALSWADKKIEKKEVHAPAKKPAGKKK
ncbi:MAG: DNA-directed RNA polymerase [Candidatus Aenigmarchaeota archaeon]|nr:DNA-directed RNA polymerase [Candidatus Aenigmarchaeota archaeon]